MIVNEELVKQVAIIVANCEGDYNLTEPADFELAFAERLLHDLAPVILFEFSDQWN